MNPSRRPLFSQHKLAAVCRELGLRLLILFGSRAEKGSRIKPESDLDLGVLFPPGAKEPDYGTCLDRLTGIFSRYDLDPGFLNRADPLFRYEVMRDGIVLYGEDLDFLEYRAFAFRDFVDSRDLRDLECRLFRRKMAFIRKELHGTN